MNIEFSLMFLCLILVLTKNKKKNNYADYSGCLNSVQINKKYQGNLLDRVLEG